MIKNTPPTLLSQGGHKLRFLFIYEARISSDTICHL